MLGEQAGKLLTEDAAWAVGGAAEEASGGEAQQGGSALDWQVVGGAAVAAVDLVGRSGTKGTGDNRGRGAQAKSDGLGGDLDTVEAEPGIGQQQWEQRSKPPRKRSRGCRDDSFYATRSPNLRKNPKFWHQTSKKVVQ